MGATPTPPASTTNRPGRRVPAGAAAGQAAARRGAAAGAKAPAAAKPLPGTQHPTGGRCTHTAPYFPAPQDPPKSAPRTSRHSRCTGEGGNTWISWPAASRTGLTALPANPPLPVSGSDTFPQVGSPLPRPVTALQRRQARIGAHASACASLSCRECLARECICLCRSCRQVTLMESWGTDTMACTAASAAAMVVMVGTPRLTAARRIS